MQLVERHVIKRADVRYAPIDAAAFASKNLYNAANYVVRQSFIQAGVYLDYQEMHRRMTDHEAYQALPRQGRPVGAAPAGSELAELLCDAGRLASRPLKVPGTPQLPGYKDKQKGRNLLVYSIQALSIPAFAAGIIVPSMLGIK